MSQSRDTFFCWSFGRKIDGIYVTANSVKTARDLAAHRLRVHRSMVSVKREPVDGHGFYQFSF